MAERTARELTDEWVAAMNAQDFGRAMAVLHPDFVEEYPQSGERVRGRENLRAIVENYPGDLRNSAAEAVPLEAVGGDRRWAIAPNYTVIDVTSVDDVSVHTFRTSYPDGSTWYIVGFVRLRDGLIWRRKTYFAPLYDPPEWRRQWVELMDRVPTQR